MSVAPERQGHKIGAKLVEAAIDELKTLGANGCVLLGDPSYYSRFGFAPHQDLTLPGVPTEYFQALALLGNPPKADVRYHDSFSASA